MGTRPIRIPPLPPDAWSEDTRAQLGGVIGVGANTRPIHLPAVIAHHPTFLGPYLEWAKAIALHGALSARHNELLTLRTAFRCRSEFEWGVHSQYARRPDCLSDEEVAAIADGLEAPQWSPIERALLAAADELHDNAVVSETTWTVLAEHFDEASLLEIVFVVGHYTMLSMVANSAGVQVVEGWEPLPDARA